MNIWGLKNSKQFYYILYFWIKYDIGQKYYTPRVQLISSNSWPPDHDSTFHVTETPALTTWPSVTSHSLRNIPHWPLTCKALKHYQMMTRLFKVNLDGIFTRLFSFFVSLSPATKSCAWNVWWKVHYVSITECAFIRATFLRRKKEEKILSTVSFQFSFLLVLLGECMERMW